MALQNSALNIQKRRRRRPQYRPSVSARLLLDDRMKGEVGVLSEDLFANLFPAYKRVPDPANQSPDENRGRVHHVAITPWSPTSTNFPQTAPWTLLPVRAPEKSGRVNNCLHSSLQFPSTSLALQSFASAYHVVSPSRTPRRDAPIEIRITDVIPLGLDTVYVTIDCDALKKLDEVHQKFGGGFGGDRPSKGVKGRFTLPSVIGGSKCRDMVREQEKVWRNAVKEALDAPRIIHTGDLLPLKSIASHPITHVPPPPAKITACEPVSQGILLPSTRVIILHAHNHFKATQTAPPVPPSPITNGSFSDEDTSNEQFYSAAEDRSATQTPSPPDEDVMVSNPDNLDSELSGTDAGDLSDDPDDMISLNAPLLPQSPGILSAFTSATPRPLGSQVAGIMSPVSVYSSFTTTTVRGPITRGKLFQAHGLLESIPEELLHPKPSNEDDDEARVFVDTNTLAKVGCFSGDWVKIEAAAEPVTHGLGEWGLAAFGNGEEEHPEWRTVKIYGLPENLSKKPVRYHVNKASDRRTSFIGLPHLGTNSYAHLSPILLSNLGGPTHIRISPLLLVPVHVAARPTLQRNKITSTSSPPRAKEVTLLKISSPRSTDRLLQPSLFAGLKHFFEQKRRIVKTGDFVGIAIDEALGKAVFQGTITDEELGTDEILVKSKHDDRKDIHVNNGWRRQGVAWFKVGNIIPDTSEHCENEGDPWGGVTTIDASKTKMIQAGSEQGRFPPTINSVWEYYLGAKRLPAPPSFLFGKGAGLINPPKPYISSLRRRLRELISAAVSPTAIHLGLPPLAILLTSTQRQIGKTTIAFRACQDLGLHTFIIDSFDILTEAGAGGGDVKTEAFLKTRAERALACGAEYTSILIKHVEALNADRMITALKEVLAESRVLIATTTEVDKVPEGIRSLFTHELEMTAPDEGEREGILREIVSDCGIGLSPDVDPANIAMKTAALVAGDLVDVVDRAVIAQRERLEMLAASATKATASDTPITIKDIELAGGATSHSLIKADFDTAVDAARKNFADAIGAPKIPNVMWEDVGGLAHVKDAVMETIQLPLSRPELFAKGMKKRSGILFYGPPGTGKTLLAKAIATEFSLNFFSVKGPELLNMYIGESEANVRRVFQRARDARPCVVFFDELDSVAPKRGNQGDSGGVMDRIVSQLLAELDGMSDGEEGGGGVFVIGATNRPDLLDQALLRPGRFDKMLYLGISDTHEKQLTILEALTRKFTLSSSLSLRSVAETLPFTYTGADLYALCSDAMLKAITRSAAAVDAKVTKLNTSASTRSSKKKESQVTVAQFFDHYATEDDLRVVVMEEDFQAAKAELIPSVSKEELEHYERVRRTFEGDTKSKTDTAKHKVHEEGASLEATELADSRTPSDGRTKPGQKGKVRNKGKSKMLSGFFGRGGSPGTRGESDDDVEGITNIPPTQFEYDDEYIIRGEEYIKSSNSVGTAGIDERLGWSNSEVYERVGRHLNGFGDATDRDEELYS